MALGANILLSILNMYTRTKEYPEGKPNLSPKDLLIVRKSNMLTDATWYIARQSCERCIPWSVENPAGSLIWHTPGFKQLQHDYELHRVAIDFCMWGREYKKHTFLYTWHPDNAIFFETLGSSV